MTGANEKPVHRDRATIADLVRRTSVFFGKAEFLARVLVSYACGTQSPFRQLHDASGQLETLAYGTIWLQGLRPSILPRLPLSADNALGPCFTMGVITSCFRGIIRDVLGKEDSIIISHEIYVTAAVVAAATYVRLNAVGTAHEVSVVITLAGGFGLRAGALAFGWSLPR